MFQDDPLIYHGLVKCGWLKAMLESIQDAESKIEKLELPALFIHGQDDAMVPIKSSEFAYATISSKDKTFEVYMTLYMCICSQNSQFT